LGHYRFVLVIIPFAQIFKLVVILGYFVLGLLLLDLCRIGPLQSRVLDLDCGSSWGCEPSFPCFQRLFRFVNLFSELENPGFENPNLMMARGGGGGGGGGEEYCTMEQLLLT
jgi:hypothetical protein